MKKHPHCPKYFVQTAIRLALKELQNVDITRYIYIQRIYDHLSIILENRIIFHIS